LRNQRKRRKYSTEFRTLFGLKDWSLAGSFELDAEKSSGNIASNAYSMYRIPLTTELWGVWGKVRQVFLLDLPWGLCGKAQSKRSAPK